MFHIKSMFEKFIFLDFGRDWTCDWITSLQHVAWSRTALMLDSSDVFDLKVKNDISEIVRKKVKKLLLLLLLLMQKRKNLLPSVENESRQS